MSSENYYCGQGDQGFRGEPKLEMRKGSEGEKILTALNLPVQSALAPNTHTPTIKTRAPPTLTGLALYLQVAYQSIPNKFIRYTF